MVLGCCTVVIIVAIRLQQVWKTSSDAVLNTDCVFGGRRKGMNKPKPMIWQNKMKDGGGERSNSRYAPSIDKWSRWSWKVSLRWGVTGENKSVSWRTCLSPLGERSDARGRLTLRDLRRSLKRVSLSSSVRFTGIVSSWYTGNPSSGLTSLMLTSGSFNWAFAIAIAVAGSTSSGFGVLWWAEWCGGWRLEGLE